MKFNRLILLFGFLIYSYSIAAQTVLYWVGNSGNWSDAAHWSQTSGGAPGAGVPNASTNVIFDQNSFQTPGATVNLDLAAAHCNDMIWIDGIAPINPVLAGDSLNQLIIHGSLILSNQVIIAYRGDFWMNALDSNNVIDSKGKTLMNFSLSAAELGILIPH